MPLTLSHPAVVLPLRRLGLPMTVLVLASMVPDVPLFLGWTGGYEASHSPLGIVTVDLVAAGVAVAGWFFVVRDPLVDLAPSPVRRRVAAHARLTARQWALAPLAAVLGAATHVVWDSFTHPGRWGARQVGWLQAEHAGLEGSSWAQYVSGVVGLVVVVAAAVAHLRAADPHVGDRASRVLPLATLPGVVAAGALVGAASAARSASSGLRAMAFHGVVDSIVVVTAALAVVSVAWHLACRLRSVHP